MFSRSSPKRASRSVRARVRASALVLLLLASAWGASCLRQEVKLPADARRIVFLHLNDTHGHFYGKLNKGARPDHGYSFENLVAWVARIEGEVGADSVILSLGGDLNTGTPESDELGARPDMDLLRQARLRVATIGNHEFDRPPAFFERQAKESSFAWVSANVLRPDGSPVVPPSIVLRAGDRNIAFVGLTTEQTNQIGNPRNIAGYRFSRAIDAARAQVDKLRPQSDFIVALTHLGFYPPGKVPHDATDDRKLAEAVPGLNLILGGHSHTLVKDEVVNGVPIFQAKCFAEYLVRVDFGIRPRASGSPPVLLRSEMIPLNRAPEQLSADALARSRRARESIDAYLARSREMFSRVVAQAQEDFHYERAQAHSSAIGRLVAESQVVGSGADVALVIAGGVRGGFKKGAITLRDVLTVCPFRNTVGTVEMTGRELIELLQSKMVASADRGAFPIVRGMTVRVEGGRVAVQRGGRPLSADARVRVAINSYMASGGSGYPDYVSSGRFRDLGVSDADMLRRYLEQKKQISRALVAEP